MVALLQAHDGRINPTGLTAPVLEHFGLTSHLDMVFQVSHGLVTADESKEGVGPDSGSESTAQDAASVGLAFIHRQRRGPLARHEVASLCPTVVRVARQGDPKAAEILAQAGRELGRLAVAVIRRLGMEQEAFAVVPFGGVFRARELVLDTFEATFRAVAPGAQVVEPRFEPVVGGVLLALAEIGVDTSDAVLSILEQSASRFPACRIMGRT
jgi:N-acetylglucosamine kinase-like BadF-type ATPase